MFLTIRTIYCLHRFYLPFSQRESIAKNTIFFILISTTKFFLQKVGRSVRSKDIKYFRAQVAQRATSWNTQRATSWNVTPVVYVAAGIRINPTMSFASVVSEFSSLTKSWTSPCGFSKITCSKVRQCVSPLRLWKYSVRISRDGNLIE